MKYPNDNTYIIGSNPQVGVWRRILQMTAEFIVFVGLCASVTALLIVLSH